MKKLYSLFQKAVTLLYEYIMKPSFLGAGAPILDEAVSLLELLALKLPDCSIDIFDSEIKLIMVIGFINHINLIHDSKGQ